MRPLCGLLLLAELHLGQAYASQPGGAPRAAARASARTAPRGEHRGALTHVRAAALHAEEDAASRRLLAAEAAMAAAAAARAAAAGRSAAAAGPARGGRPAAGEARGRRGGKDDAARLEWVLLALLRVFAVLGLAAHGLAGELDGPHCLPLLCVLLLARRPHHA